MKTMLRSLLVVMASAVPASAHDWGASWAAQQAEYGPDLERARYEATLCLPQMLGLIEQQRMSMNQRTLQQYQRSLRAYPLLSVPPPRPRSAIPPPPPLSEKEQASPDKEPKSSTSLENEPTEKKPNESR